MKYYIDGYTTEGNPSPIGGGFSIVDKYGTLLIRFPVKKKGFTNNEAELLGLSFCLKHHCERGDTISTDSMNTIHWVKRGKSKKARPDLNPVISEVKRLVDSLGIFLVWESREKNLAGIYNDEVIPIQWKT